MAYGVSNSHVIYDVTWPRKVNRDLWPLCTISRKKTAGDATIANYCIVCCEWGSTVQVYSRLSQRQVGFVFSNFITVVLSRDKYRKSPDRSPRLLSVQFALTPGLYSGPGVYPGPGFYRKSEHVEGVNFRIPYALPSFDCHQDRWPWMTLTCYKLKFS